MYDQNEEHKLTPAERELEEALGKLAPAAVSINRDDLMFEMGQASSKGRMRVWQGATGMMAAALLTFILLPFANSTATHPDGTIVKQDETSKPDTKLLPDQELVRDDSDKRGRIVVSQESANDSPIPVRSMHLPENSYAVLRQIALSKGIDALPSNSTSSRRSNDESDPMQMRRPGQFKSLFSRGES